MLVVKTHLSLSICLAYNLSTILLFFNYLFFFILSYVSFFILLIFNYV